MSPSETISALKFAQKLVCSLKICKRLTFSYKNNKKKYEKRFKIQFVMHAYKMKKD